MEINAKNFNIPPVFGWLSKIGNINDAEMLRTYNCGVGLVLIVAKDCSRHILAMLHEHSPSIIGQTRLY